MGMSLCGNVVDSRSHAHREIKNIKEIRIRFIVEPRLFLDIGRGFALIFHADSARWFCALILSEPLVDFTLSTKQFYERGSYGAVYCGVLQ